MVVVSGSRVRKVTADPSAGTLTLPSSPPEMTARAVLTCRPNSHPFQERTLTLDVPAKIGRSVARAKAANNNAIFDCKVLSRHHALLWFENGKFYLQDTKSSNGTFVNNTRLSEGGKESAPHEIYSDDIVQFGVDVVENNRKVTHGCVIALLKLYLPDGKEAKTGYNVGTGGADELYRLAQHLREAIRREQQLESKLNSLQRLVEQARQAAELGWRAAVDEDRLLSRVEILESQLRTYSKNCGDDMLREELLRLQEDKNAYQVAAKDSLQRLHKERLDAMAKVTVLERAAESADEERCAALEQCSSAQEELRQLAIQLADSRRFTTELLIKLKETETKDQSLRLKLNELLDREKDLNSRLNAIETLTFTTKIQVDEKSDLSQSQNKIINENNFKEDIEKTSSESDTTESTTSEDMDLTKVDIENLQTFQQDKLITYQHFETRLNAIEKTLMQTTDLEEKYNTQANETDKTLQTVSSLDFKLKNDVENNHDKEIEELKQQLIESQQLCKESKNEAQQMKDKIAVLLSELENRPTKSQYDEYKIVCESLKEKLKLISIEKAQFESECIELKKAYSECDFLMDTSHKSELEDELVLIKEKYDHSMTKNADLGRELQIARNKIQALTSRSHTVLFCYMAPLILIIAYLLVSSAIA